MNKALLDTDTLSEVGKGKNATIAANANTYRKVFGRYSGSSRTTVRKFDSDASCCALMS